MNQFPGSLLMFGGIPSLIREPGAKARIAALCVLGCVAALGSPVLAQTATTSTLAITNGGNAATTVPFGTVVTLTATVTAGATPVSPGQVKFCDATAAHCEDIHILGTAQLTSAGIAAVKFRPGVGSHSYNAVFLGTPNGSPARAGSTSGNVALTVTAPALYPSVTQMSVAGATGAYQLGATVSGIGSVPPTGTVSFLDTTNGNAQLGTASLSNASSSFGFANVSNPVGGAAFAVADFNMDGIPDMFAGGQVFLGKGDGTFTAVAGQPVGAQATGVLTGDFNGDGIPDLVLIYQGSSIGVLLGKGDGTFTAAATPSLGVNAFAFFIAAGDFNGDGNLDIAVLTNFAGVIEHAYQINILLGHGDGTFTLGPTSPVNNGALNYINFTSMAVADFNGDGALDIVVASEPSEDCLPETGQTSCNESSLDVLLGNGTGTFSQSTITLATSGPQYLGTVVAADLNGDGFPDLAVVGSVNEVGLSYTLLGKGDGTFTQQTPVNLGGNQPQSLAVSDFNGDGIPDLALTYLYDGLPPQPDGLMLLFGIGDGTFANPPYQLNFPGIQSNNPLAGIAAADFNGDGFEDLAISGWGVLLSQTQFDVAPPQTPVALNGVGTHLIAASYQGDANYTASTSNTTALNLSEGTPTVTLTFSANPTSWATLDVLTSVVSGNGPTPTGYVTFSFTILPGYLEGSSTSREGYLDSNGVATFTAQRLLNAGVYSVVASYSGDTNYPSAQSLPMSLTVINQSAPIITWPAPASITYGTALSATQLDATSGAAGTYVYSPAAGTFLSAGTHTLSVAFTPTDPTAYSTATAAITIAVTQATPAITWAAPAAITYGTALAATQLSATSATAGSFVYTPAAGTILIAGTHNLSVTFTPTDTTDYTTSSANVPLTVEVATPAVTWTAPSAIAYGTALSATQLSATSTVAGGFAYAPAAGTVLGAGMHTLSATLTPTDSIDYTTATATVSLTVSQATPAVTWSTPSAITFGTALTAAQLNATSTVAGTFVYTPAAGTVLSAGTQTLSATFTPTDTVDNTTASATTTLTVNKAAPLIALTTSASSAYVLNPVIFTATLTSPAGAPTGTVAFYDGMALVGTESMTSGLATYQTSALLAGTHSITAVYSGDINFLTETSSALSQIIENFTVGSSGGTSSVTASPGGQAVYTFTVTPPAGTTFAGPISFSVTGLPLGATSSFAPTTVPAGSGSTTVTMTVTLPASASAQPAERPFPGGELPVVLGLILLPFAGRARRAARGLSGTICLLVIGLGLAVTLTACGGSGGGGSGGNSGNPPENYVLTVTATAGSLSNTFSVGLVVQ